NQFSLRPPPARPCRDRGRSPVQALRGEGPGLRCGRMPTMVEQSIWMKKVTADPGHSTWYIERFRAMARAGKDLAGEARLVDAMVPRGARILDAGCGTGRVGGALAQAGHDVVGVDVDPVLIEAAEQDYPGPRYLVGDLAELDLPARGITEPFDVIVCAGDVMAGRKGLVQ